MNPDYLSTGTDGIYGDLSGGGGGATAQQGSVGAGGFTSFLDDQMKTGGDPQALSIPTIGNWEDLEDDDDETQASEAGGAFDNKKDAGPTASRKKKLSSFETESSLADTEVTAVTESSGDMVVYNEAMEDTAGQVELPAHSCRYCGYHDPLSVARCNTCKKWFCNSNSHSKASHIIQHMVMSKHKELSLHAEGPLGDAPLECYVCGTKNIFLLGFVPSKQDSVVVLLCRDPCLQSSTLKEMDWDPDAWLPLIEEKQLLSWMAEVPAPKQTERCRVLTYGQISALEALWKKNPDADLDDLIKGNNPLSQFLPIPVHFEDGYKYREVFQPLVEEECEEGRKVKEALVYTDISVQWEIGLNNKQLVIFQLPLEESAFGLGDELRMSLGKSWEGTATILRIEAAPNAGDELHCEMKNPLEAPKSTTSGFSVTFVFKAVTFDRMKAAMRTMASEESSLSNFLYKSILGQETGPLQLKTEIPDELSAPGLATLNESQRKAVRKVLTAPLSLIQGPPGTGKTVTSASIVYHMCQQNRAQVLVCSPSNIAVDQLAERVDKTGLKVVRLCARSRESVSSTIDSLMLHVQVKQFIDNSPAKSELRKLQKLKDAVGDLSKKDLSRYLRLIRTLEEDLIAAADVICATCSGAGDARLSTYRFKHVLIDEVTQATEPEILVPIVMGAKQVVLVGDHCQLGPVVINKSVLGAGYGRSLFERLLLLGHHPIRLDIQYRMHPCIAEFSANNFYEGTLQNGVTEEDRDSSKAFPWPKPSKPMFFYNSVAPEEVGATGTSFLNRTEAALAEKFVTTLMKNGVKPDEIGIVTPYEGQRCYLVNYLVRNGSQPQECYRRIEVASVDSFQGREKEYIVLTCVRSNDKQGIGFLGDWRRLNVALTRAKRGLMIVGNAPLLSSHQLWHTLLTHFKNHGLVVDGPVNDLKYMDVKLRKPYRDLQSNPMGKQYQQLGGTQQGGQAFAGGDPSTQQGILGNVPQGGPQFPHQPAFQMPVYPSGLPAPYIPFMPQFMGGGGFGYGGGVPMPLSESFLNAATNDPNYNPMVAAAMQGGIPMHEFMYMQRMGLMGAGGGGGGGASGPGAGTAPPPQPTATKTANEGGGNNGEPFPSLPRKQPPPQQPQQQAQQNATGSGKYNRRSRNQNNAPQNYAQAAAGRTPGYPSSVSEYNSVSNEVAPYLEYDDDDEVPYVPGLAPAEHQKVAMEHYTHRHEQPQERSDTPASQQTVSGWSRQGN